MYVIIATGKPCSTLWGRSVPGCTTIPLARAAAPDVVERLGGVVSDLFNES
jgi:hypothetical protein